MLEREKKEKKCKKKKQIRGSSAVNMRMNRSNIYIFLTHVFVFTRWAFSSTVIFVISNTFLCDLFHNTSL